MLNSHDEQRFTNNDSRESDRHPPRNGSWRLLGSQKSSLSPFSSFVKPQRAGRGQTLSAGQHRQLHLLGRAIVDSSRGSGVGAPVHLIEWIRASPSEPPLQRRKRHPELGRNLPLGSALADCSDHVSPTVVKRFFSSCHLLPCGRNTLADRELLTRTLTEMC